ncbi:hypothetical protein Ciccas_003384 [Cichlidogyrus casuarinus]|uniref:Uncharacterized protein n=1 Tax=Cichlidogyrus casuarinus TaxID=1844966 RepID=A0ABD2QGU5_9PLAT
MVAYMKARQTVADNLGFACCDKSGSRKNFQPSASVTVSALLPLIGSLSAWQPFPIMKSFTALAQRDIACETCDEPVNSLTLISLQADPMEDTRNIIKLKAEECQQKSQLKDPSTGLVADRRAVNVTTSKSEFRPKLARPPQLVKSPTYEEEEEVLASATSATNGSNQSQSRKRLAPPELTKEEYEARFDRRREYPPMRFRGPPSLKYQREDAEGYEWESDGYDRYEHLPPRYRRRTPPPRPHFRARTPPHIKYRRYEHPRDRYEDMYPRYHEYPPHMHPRRERFYEPRFKPFHYRNRERWISPAPHMPQKRFYRREEPQSFEMKRYASPRRYVEVLRKEYTERNAAGGSLEEGAYTNTSGSSRDEQMTSKQLMRKERFRMQMQEEEEHEAKINSKLEEPWDQQSQEPEDYRFGEELEESPNQPEEEEGGEIIDEEDETDEKEQL